jgi:hypothetical protein
VPTSCAALYTKLAELMPKATRFTRFGTGACPRATCAGCVAASRAT